MTDRTPPTDTQLDELEQLIGRTTPVGAVAASPHLLKMLLAEVRRQRAELAELRGENAKLVRWHREDETALAEMRATIERLRGDNRSQPHEAAIEALRSAAEHVRIGAAVGPIPLEVRPAVDAWLCRLAEQRLDRARQEARSARQGVAVSAPQPDSGLRDRPEAPSAPQSRTGAPDEEATR